VGSWKHFWLLLTELSRSEPVCLFGYRPSLLDSPLVPRPLFSSMRRRHHPLCPNSSHFDRLATSLFHPFRRRPERIPKNSLQSNSGYAYRVSYPVNLVSCALNSCIPTSGLGRPRGSPAFAFLVGVFYLFSASSCLFSSLLILNKT
jgi:hypothetical protein